MSSLNKVMIIGRLGRDPELRNTPNGATVVSVSAATSRSWKDKTSGEKVEETEWHRLVAYDRLAEVIGKYLKKGSLAYFEGRLKTRKWQDKEGRDVYTTEIVVDQAQMLGGRDEQQGEGNNQPPRRPPPAASAPPPTTRNTYADVKGSRTSAPAPTKTGTGFDDMDDDIPF